MFTEFEPEIGTREWKDRYIYDEPQEFFSKFPDERNDHASMLLAVQLYKDKACRTLVEDLSDNEEFMSKAVEVYSSSFAFASDRLRDNEEFAARSVEADVSNMRFISDRLGGQRDFLVAMVNLHPPGKLSAFDNLPLPSASDYFSFELKDRIGDCDARDYFRREELFERLHRVVPNKVDAQVVKKRKI